MKILLSLLFAFSANFAFADQDYFFTRPDLRDAFENQVEDEAGDPYRFEVGEYVYADKNNDGKYSQYQIKAIIPNGDYLANEVGFTNTYRFTSQELGSSQTRLTGRQIFADSNNDSVFVEYKIVGRMGRKILAREVGFNKIVSFRRSEIAFRTQNHENVFVDRNNDGKYARYVIKGIFGNGDVIVQEVGFTKYYRESVEKTGFGSHWLVGQTAYGDNNHDGKYVQYNIAAILPDGRLVAREVGFDNYPSFSPDDLGYTSGQTAYDVYRMLCDNLRLY
jgi:hypothetical protein